MPEIKRGSRASCASFFGFILLLASLLSNEVQDRSGETNIEECRILAARGDVDFNRSVDRWRRGLRRQWFAPFSNPLETRSMSGYVHKFSHPVLQRARARRQENNKKQIWNDEPEIEPGAVQLPVNQNA